MGKKHAETLVAAQEKTLFDGKKGPRKNQGGGVAISAKEKGWSPTR